MEAEERDLEAHFDQQAALGNLAQWYQDAVEFLKRIDDDHWWCTHTRITAGLAETLRCALLRCKQLRMPIMFLTPVTALFSQCISKQS